MCIYYIYIYILHTMLILLYSVSMSISLIPQILYISIQGYSMCILGKAKEIKEYLGNPWD